MHFLSDAMAKLEGLLEVNREFCKQRMAENASLAPLPNCAVLPEPVSILYQAQRSFVKEFFLFYALCLPTIRSKSTCPDYFFRASECQKSGGAGGTVSCRGYRGGAPNPFAAALSPQTSLRVRSTEDEDSPKGYRSPKPATKGGRRPTSARNG